MDLDQVRMSVGTESEVYRAVAGRSVADARGHVVILRSALGHKLDARADTIAIAFGAT